MIAADRGEMTSKLILLVSKLEFVHVRILSCFNLREYLSYYTLKVLNLLDILMSTFYLFKWDLLDI